MKNLNKKRKGVFVPDEFFELDLTHTEMFMLAIYKYYTEEGELNCCVYTNQNIAEILKVSVKTVKKAKKRFKELGYIRTDGGIRTYYTGIAEGKNFHEVGKNIPEVGKNIPEVGKNIPEVGKNIPEGGEKNSLLGGEKNSLLGGEQSSPHNKEEKRIKKEIIKNKKRENKEENKEEMKSELKEKQTVFDRMIPFMNQETKEHIDYIRETYKEQIDNINQVEELVEEDDITESYLRDQLKLFKHNILDKDDKIISDKKVVHKEKKEDDEMFDI